MYKPMSVERAGLVDEYIQGALLKAELDINNAPLRGRNLRVNVRCFDALAVGMVFLNGFAAMSDGKLEASPLLRTWLDGPSTRERSARLVANMTAVQLCAELDAYLPDLAHFGLEFSVDFANRHAAIHRELNAARGLKGERLVDQALRSSAKKWAKWPEYVRRLFDAPRDSMAVEALEDLVGARGCAAHENHAHIFSGEHLSVWFASCQAVEGAERQPQVETGLL
jgi:hypothetical protein